MALTTGRTWFIFIHKLLLWGNDSWSVGALSLNCWNTVIHVGLRACSSTMRTCYVLLVRENVSSPIIDFETLLRSCPLYILCCFIRDYAVTSLRCSIGNANNHTNDYSSMYKWNFMMSPIQVRPSIIAITSLPFSFFATITIQQMALKIQLRGGNLRLNDTGDVLKMGCLRVVINNVLTFSSSLVVASFRWILNNSISHPTATIRISCTMISVL